MSRNDVKSVYFYATHMFLYYKSSAGSNVCNSGGGVCQRAPPSMKILNAHLILVYCCSNFASGYSQQ